MKNSIHIFILYVMSFAFLGISCTEEDAPKPMCMQVEVIGEDCNSGWFILNVENKAALQENSYKGQLQSGYVTTDNLPLTYRQPGLKFNTALELNGDYGPRCTTLAVMYPAVKVAHICETTSTIR
jgi:hypothetical protein